jgi:putative hydrolase of the HAD superfamily
MLEVILFDLDNTLYTEESGIFELIDQRMSEWLITRLKIPESEVREFRRKYFLQYGTTLRGLMLHHQVDPMDFLTFVHDVPVKDFLTVDLELRGTLEEVTSRKIIFTNSDAAHANRILDALGIRDLFEKIFDIEAMGFIPKPNQEAYAAVLQYAAVQPSECLLIDDMTRNLKPARALGMRTVLIGSGEPPEDAHDAIENIKELNTVLHRIVNTENA